MSDFENSKMLSWISTLRGIAAFLVFISHLYLVNGTPIGFIIGRIGVVIFFLMTGYLSVKARETRNGKQYLLNRFFRLFPVYWLLLLIHYMTLRIFTADFPSVISFLANLTHFEQIFGFDEILGGSWMLPMMDVYFVALSIFEVAFWCNKYNIKRITVHIPLIVMLLLMILSILTGFIRYITNIPLPAAFFLLLAVAFLGMYKKKLKNITDLLIIFEIGLVLTTIFAYSNEWIYYIIAYNVGIFVFLMAEKNSNLNIKAFNELSKIGFTFFLGAGTPMVILKHYIDFKSSVLLIVVSYVIQFLLAAFYSYAVTRFVEKPLLRFEKKIEKKYNYFLN